MSDKVIQFPKNKQGPPVPIPQDEITELQAGIQMLTEEVLYLSKTINTLLKQLKRQSK